MLKTRRESALRLVSGSHTYGACLQEVAGRAGIAEDVRVFTMSDIDRRGMALDDR